MDDDLGITEKKRSMELKRLPAASERGKAKDFDCSLLISFLNVKSFTDKKFGEIRCLILEDSLDIITV